MGKYNGNEIPIVLWIPEGTKKLKLKAKTFDGCKMQKVLDNDGIATARYDYLTIDPTGDALTTYQLTQLLEDFLEDGGDLCDEAGWLQYRLEHSR